MSVSDLADYASILGVMLAVGGFIVTIRGVGKAQKAAEEARQAAREALLRLGERSLETDIDLAIKLLNEIVSACRGKDWSTAVLRAGDAHSLLARLSNHSSFDARQNDDLTLTIKGMSRLNHALEIIRRQPSTKDLSPTYFTQLQDAISQLSRVLGWIRSKAFEI